MCKISLQHIEKMKSWLGADSMPSHYEHSRSKIFQTQRGEREFFFFTKVFHGIQSHLLTVTSDEIFSPQMANVFANRTHINCRIVYSDRKHVFLIVKLEKILIHFLLFKWMYDDYKQIDMFHVYDVFFWLW